MSKFFELQAFLQKNGLRWTLEDLVETEHDLCPDRVFGPSDAWLHEEMIKLVRSDDELSSKIAAWSKAIYCLLTYGDPKPGQLIRIGGVPLPIDIATWPRDVSGALLPFIGQLDLRLLTDIGVAAPAFDLVQVFGDTSESGMLWNTLSERVYCLGPDFSTSESSAAPNVFKLPSFAGTPYIATEPKFAEDTEFPLSVKGDNGENYLLWSQVQWAPFAVRIGSLDSDDSAVDTGPGEQIIASIPSIVPSGQPYPFLNVSNALDEDMRRRCTLDIGNALDRDHWSVVHIALSPDSDSGVRLLLE